MGRLFEGKVALVTGAGSGIGLATALKFSQAGARVVLVDITQSGLDEVSDQIRSGGGESLAVQADVSRADDVEAAVAKTVRAYGRLDCAFNNAGVASPPDRRDTWDEAWFDRVMAVNVKGVLLGMKFQLRQMIEQKSGAVVNAASVAGLSGIGPLAYVASKHAVIGLTRAAAMRVARHGVRVNAVCPGGIATPMTLGALERKPETFERYTGGAPAGRIGEPDEVADAVVWLCSDQSKYICGHPLVIDGGRLLG
jgi:NAD(P)-dependent dehydrogenase (short-subunit alcohol dehydrogenase family)